MEQGDRFERWTVTGSPTEGRSVLCTCTCGSQKVVLKDNLRRGLSKSCGCLRREKLAEIKKGNAYGFKHGHAPDGHSSPEYAAWAKMKDRCRNPLNAEFDAYGGRGISVCASWRGSFESFLLDMGLRPGDRFSLDRINNEGNYEPDNCRWATQSQQNANRRPYKHKRLAG